MKRFLLLTGIVLVSACRPAGYPNLLQPGEGCEYASYFGILASDEDSLEVRGVVSVSPGNGACDTLFMDEPLNSIVCMSSSSVAALSAIGAESHITGVSGLKYISDEKNSPREKFLILPEYISCVWKFIKGVL